MHPIQGGGGGGEVILLVAASFINRVKLWTCVPPVFDGFGVKAYCKIYIVRLETNPEISCLFAAICFSSCRGLHSV